MERDRNQRFQSYLKLSGALRGFGVAEMPPVIFGGKSEAKRRRLTSGGVNNHWNVTEIKDFERSQEHCYAASLRYARGMHNNNIGT